MRRRFSGCKSAKTKLQHFLEISYYNAPLFLMIKARWVRLNCWQWADVWCWRSWDQNPGKALWSLWSAAAPLKPSIVSVVQHVKGWDKKLPTGCVMRCLWSRVICDTVTFSRIPFPHLWLSAGGVKAWLKTWKSVLTDLQTSPMHDVPSFEQSRKSLHEEILFTECMHAESGLYHIAHLPRLPLS